MIKKEELRIGNKLFQDGHYKDNVELIDNDRPVVEVSGTYLNPNGNFLIWTKGEEASSCPIKLFSPILLTEEWLKKLGAQQHHERKDMFSLFGYVLVITSDKDVMFIKGNLICELTLCHLKYVHQLQNLFFALTGEELQIKS